MRLTSATGRGIFVFSVIISLRMFQFEIFHSARKLNSGNVVLVLLEESRNALSMIGSIWRFID